MSAVTISRPSTKVIKKVKVQDEIKEDLSEIKTVKVVKKKRVIESPLMEKQQDTKESSLKESSLKEQSLEKEVDEIVKDDTTNTNQDSSFILKKNKQSGNFSILKKSSRPGVAQRVRYVAYNALLPYGREEYNDNLILNAIINDSTNLNHNLITTLKRIIHTFEALRDTEPGKYKYSINDKKFFSYMKEIETPYNAESDTEKTKNQQNPPIRKYQLRLYLRYGAKVLHAKHVGELSYDQLKGKRCNLDLELGSMWVSGDTMMYGINIHVTRITVLN